MVIWDISMYKICKQCNKKFIKKSSYSKKNWSKVKYCSQKCTQINTNKNLVHGINKGKKLKITEKGMISKRFHSSGKNNYFWEGGKSELKRQIYNLYEYRQWRSDIFYRDNWTCLGCGKRGGQLDCHHIKAFSLIISINNITKTEDAVNCEELWNINNGQTLCRECHKKTDNYSYKAVLLNKKYPKS